MVKKKTSLLRNMTLVVGSGRLGSSIANHSYKIGKHVVVIDKNKDHFSRLDENFSGYEIVGDATDLSLLETSYIQKAREIVIVTGNDNVNIFVSHVARKIYNVPHIYVRLDDPSKSVLIEGMDIQTICPFQLSYDKFNTMRKEDKNK